MPSFKSRFSIRDYQQFTNVIYGLSNDRYFTASDMLTNIERFLMRALKAIRKRNDKKTEINLFISLSWFMSLMNQLHIDLETETWKRFPYLCSYCGKKPCVCKAQKIKKRQKYQIDDSLKPKTIKEFQEMFEAIYPSATRNLENSAIHLAEEIGELSESILTFRGSHKDTDFKAVALESADLFSCFMGVFNNLGVDVSKALSKMFNDNCHVCHKSPCECTFDFIMSYKV